MKKIKSLFFISLCFIITIVNGHEKGNGGLGVVIDHQAYLLDFAERNLEKTAYIKNLPLEGNPVCKRRGLYGVCLETTEMRTGLMFENGSIVRSLFVNENGKYTKFLFMDDLRESFFDQIIRASNEGNKFIFGKKLMCQDCYTPDVLVAVFLTNQFVNSGYGGIRSSKKDIDTDSVIYQYHTLSIKHFLDYFNKLTWILSDQELTNHQDANSSFPGERIVLAERINGVVSIAQKFWSTGTKDISPLDLRNKLGLIVHEVFYYWTELQGDENSDRAREISSLQFYEYMDYVNKNNEYPSTVFYRLLGEVPNHPKTSSEVVFVHELNSDSYIEVMSPISFETEMCAALMYDPKIKSATTFPGSGGKLYDRDRYHRVIKTQLDYINANICLNTNVFPSFTLQPGVRLKVSEVFTQYEWFQYPRDTTDRSFFLTGIKFPKATNGARNINIFAALEKGKDSQTAKPLAVKVIDFNKMYGEILKVVP